MADPQQIKDALRDGRFGYNEMDNEELAELLHDALAKAKVRT